MSTARKKPPAVAPGPARAVTMADVAARVGVSKMTVSRALNRGESRDRSTSEELRQNMIFLSE